MKNKPCAGCPFSRRIRPGALGGSPPLVYIGQTAGPFVLHCHSAPGYSVEASRDNPCGGLRPCIGAAIFRANTDVAPFLPEPIHREPKDEDAVFATPAEFLAHHCRATLKEAQQFLELHPVAEHVNAQLARPTNKITLIPKQ